MALDPSEAKCARSRSTSSKVNHLALLELEDRPCGSSKRLPQS